MNSNNSSYLRRICDCFNFCFYDNNVQDFYKFNDVVLELETGEQIPLSCYDRKISRTDIANKMLDLLQYTLKIL